MIQANVIIFGENQLYIYFANIDIRTGLIFHEGTHEYFYKDVCGITSEQILKKKFNSKKKQFQDFVHEQIIIYTAGCQHLANFNTAVNKGALDKQFLAMRNLIRDKKEEKV